ncbi:MAG TPA: 4-hydroxythreonine-4-phosphate dehydrogenase PdxA [Candidatus Obscuribacterales bacterium]
MNQSATIDQSQVIRSARADNGPLPRLAIALGDPAGIGPEVVLKALSNPAVQAAAEVTLIGHAACLEATLAQIDPSGALAAIARAFPLIEPGVPLPGLATVQPGVPSAMTGHASFVWLQRAIAGCLNGEFDAVVTAPIAKAVWHAAGHLYPGQTEVLAQRAGVERFGMLFAARSPHTHWQLRCLLATTHIPLQQVPAALTPELMTRKLALLVEALQQDFGIPQPHIAIAGLNPHRGEAGQLGTEERDWLIPWLETARHTYPQVQLTGPVPPDTLWVTAGQAWYDQPTACPYDAYLALYHDQGLIPVKLLAFDRAVNTTIGLPFVRTSPDHGTAFDIAGQGKARPESMTAAIDLAIALVHQRKRPNP